MPKPITLTIKEDLNYLEKLHKKTTTLLLKDRIKTLIYIKQGKYSYRSSIAKKLGRKPNTIGLWIVDYMNHGLSSYLSIETGGNNKRHLSDAVIDYISKKLTDSSTTITSYVELQHLIKQELSEDVNYGALYAHCKRKHQSKLKVARKSHYKKHEQAIEVFKKPKN